VAAWRESRHCEAEGRGNLSLNDNNSHDPSKRRPTVSTRAHRAS
jgi:hypothetical protein